MQIRLPRKIRGSFSAKITLLVACSVVLTSLVVGFVTTHSMGGYLTERLKDKFPSTLANTNTRVRGWYERQFAELGRLAQSSVFQDNLGRWLEASRRGYVHRASLAEVTRYLRLVHPKYAVYEDLFVLGPEGGLMASAAGTREDQVAEATQMLEESGYTLRITPAFWNPERVRVHQWLYVPARSDSINLTVHAWLVALIDLSELERILDDVKLGPGGDLFLLDAQGRFLTQPRLLERSTLWKEAMQVPTRESGPIEVERRKSYEGHEVFHSKVHIDELGWWLVYEEDYRATMGPVIEAQRRTWVAVLIVGAIAILAALNIARSILRPIRGLAQGAGRINEGLVGVKIPRGADDEIGMMIDTFNDMATKITLSQAELQYKNKMLNVQNDRLQDANEQLEKLSITDGLTGLFNHRHFWNLVNTELTRANLNRGDLALFLVDLDDFKRVNDQYGHSVGDLLLQTVSTVLRDTVRDTDIVARYGGEEFAVLLPDTDESGVQQVAEKTRAAVEAIRFNIPDTDITLKVTVSVGVSVFRGNRREFFNAADRALYQSKAAGKNRVHYALT